MADLLDVNVWLALGAQGHIHHARARRYWDTEAADELAFCRVTSLGLLRLLSSSQVLGAAALDGEDAWRALGVWQANSRVVVLDEPQGLDEILRHWAASLGVRGRHWTDAYLASFATAGGARLVTFDSDFDRYPGLSVLQLNAG